MNVKAGSITATDFGVLIQNGSGTVTNAGAIDAGAGSAAVSLQKGVPNLVEIRPGATFTGLVDGGNPIGYATHSALRLMSAATPGVVGTLNGIGAQYVNFAILSVDAGASWSLAGGGTIAPGAIIDDYGTLSNTATISNKITVAPGAVLTNASGGLINNVLIPVYGAGAGGTETIVNAGQIVAQHTTVSHSYGVALFNGGSVTNTGTGAITGDSAVMIRGGPAAIDNQGMLAGQGAYTGAIIAYGSITNEAKGLITGYRALRVTSAAGTVTNSGVISASAGAIYLSKGGSVTNTKDGTISGFLGVVVTGAVGTVENSGSIGATVAPSYAVYLSPGFANRVIADPGATFTGLVDGGNTIGAATVSTLELGGPGQGTLAGLGSQFINFAAVLVDPGASWSLGGVNSLAAGVTLTDGGILSLDGETVLDGIVTVHSGLPALGQTGHGHLIVENQGAVQRTDTPSGGIGMDIGQGLGGAGDVAVIGPNASISNLGKFVVGDAGVGGLEIQSGATVSTTPNLSLPGMVVAS